LFPYEIARNRGKSFNTLSIKNHGKQQTDCSVVSVENHRNEQAVAPGVLNRPVEKRRVDVSLMAINNNRRSPNESETARKKRD